MKNAVRWYDRERWAYGVDRKLTEEYAHWLKQVDWRLFCTFTFAWSVSDQQAIKVFAEFINRLERAYKADVGYVRGDEKRFSGCGKPACPRHFHVLLASAAPLDPTFVAWLWKEMAGNRKDDAGAEVVSFHPKLNGVSYVLKSISQPDGDWALRKLELFHPEARSLPAHTKRMRRHLRRHFAREERFRSTELQRTGI